MEGIGLTLIAFVAGSGLGGVGFYFYKKISGEKKIANAKDQARRLVDNAKREAEKLDREVRKRAQEIEQKVKKHAEHDIQKQKQNLDQTERRFRDKEKLLEKITKEKEEQLDAAKKQVEEKLKGYEHAELRAKEKEHKFHDQAEQLVRKLEQVSNYSASEAKNELIKTVKTEAEMEASRLSSKIEAEAKEDAERQAKRIISMAISRYAGEYIAEKTVSIIQLPNEEMKGKIIGREGRNIRTLEALCGVDLIVDENPENVIISGFDPVRREVARRTLLKLMEDGRIHPGRIEEVLEKTKVELFKSIKEDGEKACFELGITGVHPEILKLLGSLKYRTSYTQNNYTHSIECGFICGMMAAELGADVKVARRAGLLHDIGKALDHSISGSHAVIGAEFAKRHGESEAVCHAIRSHHEDEKPSTVIAYITQAADAISSARPGARKNMTEAYSNRLEDLESIANSFDGVMRAFAIQAGRELRVMVEASKVTDEQSLMLSRDIARKIEREMAFPGQIKVTVIRETRAVDHAR